MVSNNQLLEKFTDILTAYSVTGTEELFKYDKLYTLSSKRKLRFLNNIEFVIIPKIILFIFKSVL